MPPTVQYDSSNVSLRLKTGSPEHLGELFANPRFILPERRPHHFCAAPIPLLFGRIPWIRVENLQRKNDWRVRIDRGTLNPSKR